jgi:curli biogenesis system outer membrane secretion channel CsgG
MISTLLLLTACTSSTRQVVNPAPVTNTQISPTLNTSNDLSLKRVVAIARFSDETKRGNILLTDDNGNRLGKQAADILASRLEQTHKFIMLERQDIQEVQQEATLKGGFQKVGADYLIIGSVSQFGRSTKSEVGIFSRNKIQIATATVNVRLINTNTGEIVYSAEGSGEARSEANHVFGVGERADYDTSLDDKAISAAISKLVSNIIENLLDSPWQAYIISAKNNQILITGGKSQGIQVGQKFTVMTKGEKVKNPQTGMFIQLPGKKVAEIEVTQLAGTKENEFSVCRLTTGNLDAKQISNYVVREQK